jgi:hypothetical protein
MTKEPDITVVTTNLYRLLEPLKPEERQRAVRAALTMLGDAPLKAEIEKETREEPAGRSGGNDSPRMRAWMKANGLTQEQIDHVFHINGNTVDVLATEVPGKGGKEKTINAYVLTGIGEFVRTGESKFEDKAGRAACEKFGCYQPNNHAWIMKAASKVLSGSKDKGWAVAGPGLKAGAELVKQIAST